jgi:hypothetical protein
VRAVGPEERLAREGRLDVFEREHEQLAARGGEDFVTLRGDLDEVVVAGAAAQVQLVPAPQVPRGDDGCRETETADVAAAEPPPAMRTARGGGWTSGR